MQSSFVVTYGNWHDIAVSYDGSGSASGIKIYEDGKQDTAATVIANSLTGSIVSSIPAPLIIGNRAGYESSYDLHGSLEQFSISDVVRSAAYIAEYSLPGSVAPVDVNTALDYHFSARSVIEWLQRDAFQFRHVEQRTVCAGSDLHAADGFRRYRHLQLHR